jgi:3-deoxy-D-manno-octulosonate 8-phosphate phosphatase (KDO 8-P phosphatase)
MSPAPSMEKQSAQLQDKLKRITLLVLDVDGILSDGTLYFASTGEELKGFSILDGLGIKLLQKGGVKVAIITGRNSPLTTRRAADLGIDHIIQGREDKKTALFELGDKLNIPLQNTAYMGDDLPDLGAIKAAGASFTVPNAYWLIRDEADFCTVQPGGKGAVREVADLILSVQGKLTAILADYYY